MRAEVREQGAVAVLALCSMLAVFFLGLSLATVAGYEARGSTEYLEETRLRLAAESCVERMAAEIEHDPALLAGLSEEKWKAYGKAQSYEGMVVRGFLRPVSAHAGREQGFFLKALAKREGESDRAKSKVVCGWLERKGEGFVWCGWRGLAELPEK